MLLYPKCPLCHQTTFLQNKLCVLCIQLGLFCLFIRIENEFIVEGEGFFFMVVHLMLSYTERILKCLIHKTLSYMVVAV